MCWIHLPSIDTLPNHKTNQSCFNRVGWHIGLQTKVIQKIFGVIVLFIRGDCWAVGMKKGSSGETMSGASEKTGFFARAIHDPL